MVATLSGARHAEIHRFILVALGMSRIGQELVGSILMKTVQKTFLLNLGKDKASIHNLRDQVDKTKGVIRDLPCTQFVIERNSKIEGRRVHECMRGRSGVLPPPQGKC